MMLPRDSCACLLAPICMCLYRAQLRVELLGRGHAHVQLGQRLLTVLLMAGQLASQQRVRGPGLLVSANDGSVRASALEELVFPVLGISGPQAVPLCPASQPPSRCFLPGVWCCPRTRSPEVSPHPSDHGTWDTGLCSL